MYALCSIFQVQELMRQATPVLAVSFFLLNVSTMFHIRLNSSGSAYDQQTFHRRIVGMAIFNVSYRGFEVDHLAANYLHRSFQINIPPSQGIRRLLPKIL